MSFRQYDSRQFAVFSKFGKMTVDNAYVSFSKFGKMIVDNAFVSFLIFGKMTVDNLSYFQNLAK
jgi:hypothetical protein